MFSLNKEIAISKQLKKQSHLTGVYKLIYIKFNTCIFIKDNL